MIWESNSHNNNENTEANTKKKKLNECAREWS
jgi:hypothetical protein